MAESTKRSIGQVIFRHNPGSLIALDEWGVYGRVSSIKGNPDSDVDKSLLVKKVRWFVNKWKDDSEGRIRGFDVDNIDSDSLIAIRPEGKVMCDFLYQMLMECTNPECRVIINSAEPQFNGKCLRCGEGLRQFRYVWFHSCGILKPFQPIQQVNCPTHGRKALYLNDTGRFRSSTWRCRDCAYERGLGMLPCTDETCKRNLKGDSPYLRASVWNDPWVYFPQVVTFINLKDDQIKPVIDSDIKEELLVSSYLGSIQAGQGRLRSKAAENLQTKNCVKCGSPILANSKFCNDCGQKQPEIPRGINIEKSNTLSFELLSEDSELATFAALRDLERTQSFRDEKNKQKEENIEKATSSEIILQSLNNIGIDDILFVGDFPLTYAALGFTRFQSKPPTWLRSFPSVASSQTKIPVYTNCITTESWMIQLSAKYLLEWLSSNNFLKGVNNLPEIKSVDESQAKIWLLEFLNKEVKDESETQLANITEELIHSLSHIVLQSLAVESGLDIASFGELLLPKVLTFIIYAGESDIGGLSASFSQGIGAFLDSLINQLRSCKFDPSCSEDDDGACVGCLHLPRGCIEFKEKLSRSYAFGGKTKKLSANEIPIGYFDLRTR